MCSFLDINDRRDGTTFQKSFLEGSNMLRNLLQLFLCFLKNEKHRKASSIKQNLV